MFCFLPIYRICSIFAFKLLNGAYIVQFGVNLPKLDYFQIFYSTWKFYFNILFRWVVKAYLFLSKTLESSESINVPEVSQSDMGVKTEIEVGEVTSLESEIPENTGISEIPLTLGNIGSSEISFPLRNINYSTYSAIQKTLEANDIDQSLLSQDLVIASQGLSGLINHENLVKQRSAADFNFKKSQMLTKRKGSGGNQISSAKRKREDRQLAPGRQVFTQHTLYYISKYV